MVDDSKYVIVPNELEPDYSKGTGHPIRHGNENADYIAKLLMDDYRITKVMANRDSVHYILLKFKAGTRPKRAGSFKEQTPAAIVTSVTAAPDDDAPINLDDINF